MDSHGRGNELRKRHTVDEFCQRDTKPAEIPSVALCCFLDVLWKEKLPLKDAVCQGNLRGQYAQHVGISNVHGCTHINT